MAFVFAIGAAFAFSSEDVAPTVASLADVDGYNPETECQFSKACQDSDTMQPVCKTDGIELRPEGQCDSNTTLYEKP